MALQKKLRELIVIWCFYCDLPLTIFMNSMLSSNFNLFWHISLHRSIFDLPLTLVPCVALVNRALWKTVIIGLVLHLTWHHAFISQLIVKKWWVKNIVKNQIISKTHRSFCSALHDWATHLSGGSSWAKIVAIAAATITAGKVVAAADASVATATVAAAAVVALQLLQLSQPQLPWQPQITRSPQNQHFD